MEAALVLPAFVVAMILTISVIPIFGYCENMVFCACDELKRENIRSAFYESSITSQAFIFARLNNAKKGGIPVIITDYDYLHSDYMMDDLISVDFATGFFEENHLGALAGLGFTGKLRSRAFTGADNSGMTMGEEGFTEDEDFEKVYIFPNRGTRYHNESCPFLNPEAQKVFLTRGIRERYGDCSICRSEEAVLGEFVYCFFKAGNVYHREGCNTVDKYYVETEKRDAEAKGYTPCQTCNG